MASAMHLLTANKPGRPRIPRRAWRAVPVALALMVASAAQAGGPLRFDNAGRGIGYPASTMPLPYRVDGGGLGRLNHDQSAVLVDNAFRAWQSVSTAAIRFVNAGPILKIGGSEPIDIDKTNYGPYLNSPAPLGQNMVVFDADGSLFESFYGANTLVLGFAGPTFLANGNPSYLLESYAFFNGGFIDGRSENGEMAVEDFAGVITHELGHFIGLDHSQVNGLDFRSLSPDAIETMHPVIRSGSAQATPHKDDTVALSNLYPSPSFYSDYGSIEGVYLNQDGLTPFSGANIIARNILNPLIDAVSYVSGATLTPAGRFALRGLTPGAQYIVWVEGISTTFTDGSKVGPYSFPMALPGPPEYYSGPRESADPAVDNPQDSELLQAQAGRTQGDIRIIANRFSGAPPEVASLSAGIAKDDPASLVVSIDGRDVNADVTHVLIELLSGGSLLTQSRDARISALGFLLDGKPSFRFTVFAADLISRASLRRFLPQTTGVRVKLMDREGRFSTAVTQPPGSYTSSSTLIFPAVYSNGRTSTGLALVNLDEDTLVQSWFYYDNAGRLIASANGNPFSRSLPPAQQTAFFGNELFALNTPTEGWMEVRTNSSKAAGFFLEGDFISSATLDGAAVGASGMTRLSLPVVPLSNSLPQRVTLVNPQDFTTLVQVQAVSGSGQLIRSLSRQLPPHGRISEELPAFLGLQPGIFFEGHLRLNSTAAISALAHIGTQEASAIFPGLPVADTRRLYGAQAASGQQYRTYLTAVNSQPDPTGVTVSLRGADGSLIAARGPLKIPGYATLHEEIGALLNLPGGGQILHQGWLKVDSEATGISGLVTFAGSEGGAFLTSIPLTPSGARRFVLPHVAMLDGYYTGMSILNYGSSPATVQIRVFDAKGLLKKQSAALIGPGSREARLVEHFVPGLAPQNQGYVLLDADQEVVAVGVFGTLKLDVLASIPAIPR